MTFDEIKDLVARNEGITTVKAWELREAQGAGRLTARINEQISDSLRHRGLGHVPFRADDLPTWGDGDVRIFDATSSLGKVIAAASEVGEANDQFLRETVNGDAASLLAQVRAIVVEA